VVEGGTVPIGSGLNFTEMEKSRCAFRMMCEEEGKRKREKNKKNTGIY